MSDWIPAGWQDEETTQALLALIVESQPGRRGWGELLRRHLRGEIERLAAEALACDVDSDRGRRAYNRACGAREALEKLLAPEWGLGAKIDRVVDELRLDPIERSHHAEHEVVQGRA